MDQKLRIKVQQNNQRRELERVMGLLDDEQRGILETFDKIYQEDYFSTLPEKIWPLRYDGHDIKEIQQQFELYDYHDFDDWAHVRAAIAQNSLTLKPPVYIWICSGPVLKSAKVIDCGLLLRLFDICFQVGESTFLIAEENLQNGLLMDTYVGYLDKPRRTNDDELVHELVFFSGYRCSGSE